MPLHTDARHSGGPSEFDINPVYVRLAREPVPRHALPRHQMLPDTALQVVRDELLLDGNARLNLATFVTTWMEPQAQLLMTECLAKNMIDKDEYPQTAELEARCVNILADLWHAPEGVNATGCSTTGSSEACMLAGMALLWRWRERRRAAKAATDRPSASSHPTAPPNLVMGTNVQVCWDKFCRYWQVEPKWVPMAPGRYHLTGPEAAAQCDENTIGVVAVLGSTMDGSYEPVGEINAELDRLAAGGGPDVPIHVDGASGGFVAPFLQPDLVWDFRLPRVASINASGHKYGLVYPGVGWVVWREEQALPKDLVFNVNYLGGQMPTFALNFSRPGAQVAAQYYNFLRLGFSGYQRVHQACQDVAVRMSGRIAKMGPFELISEGRELPVFAFKIADPQANYSVFDLSERLRARGWLVPAYTFPADLTDMAVIRLVIRNGFTTDLADLFLADLDHHWRALAAYPHGCPPLVPEGKRQGFAH
ncbi:MAG TPA: glutamate decarboxylase [Streptosporangiaceae bacterium]|jgi:glutamate decarboxylase